MTKTTIADAELLPWPFFGYAPGNYMITCMTCGEVKSDADKRAIRCLECAVKASKAHEREQAEALTHTNPPSEERIEQVARHLTSVIFGMTQPDRGDVFSWFDDHSTEIATAALEAADGGMREALEGCEAYFLALEEGGREKHTGMLKLIRNGLGGFSAAVSAQGRREWAERIADQFCITSPAAIDAIEEGIWRGWSLRLPTKAALEAADRVEGGMREAVRMIKLACLGTDWEAKRILSRVIRICIDAGVTESYRELDTEQRRRAITLPVAELGNCVRAALTKQEPR